MLVCTPLNPPTVEVPAAPFYPLLAPFGGPLLLGVLPAPDPEKDPTIWSYLYYTELYKSLANSIFISKASLAFYKNPALVILMNMISERTTCEFLISLVLDILFIVYNYNNADLDLIFNN